MGNQYDTTVQHEGAASNSRRQLLKAGAALATLPIIAVSAANAQAADNQTTTGATVTDAKTEEFINGMADLMAHSTRTPSCGGQTNTAWTMRRFSSRRWMA